MKKFWRKFTFKQKISIIDFGVFGLLTTGMGVPETLKASSYHKGSS